MPLLYFPKTQFSPRFGNQFFTFELRTYVRINEASSFMNYCLPHEVIFYEIFVSRGKETWTVNRRYNQFLTFLIDLKDQIDDLPSDIVLPPKSFFNNLNKDFCDDRLKKLETFLDKCLVFISSRGIQIQDSIIITNFLKITPPSIIN